MPEPNQGTAVIVVGVDPHKKSHTAVAIDGATGQVIDQITVPATDAGHRRLARWARGLGGPIRVALEDVRHVSGRLERLLLEQEVWVVRVPPRLMGQARRTGRERGKSDPIDAAAVARAALSHPELEVPARALDRRVWLGRLSQALALMSGMRARIGAELVNDCRRLSERIDALEREIAQMADQQAPELVAIPGCGPLTAAKLVAEVAGIERFGGPAQLARYAGVAPVPVSSGMRQRHRLDRTGNRQLNLALHRPAITQARLHPPAQEYLARKIAEGKSAREARRCLKRHLVNVIFRAMRSALPSISRGEQPSLAAVLT